jgi:hypothetical protein
MPDTNLIHANSIPDYDDWGWDTSWNKQQWMNWYWEMDAVYGRTEARRRFREYYADPRMQFKMNNNAAWKYDYDFITFLEDEVKVNPPRSFVSDVVLGTTGLARGLSGATDNLGSVVRILPVVALVLGIGAVVYFTYKLANKIK